jgi:hypothetical protein
MGNYKIMRFYAAFLLSFLYISVGQAQGIIINSVLNNSDSPIILTTEDEKTIEIPAYSQISDFADKTSLYIPEFSVIKGKSTSTMRTVDSEWPLSATKVSIRSVSNKLSHQPMMAGAPGPAHYELFTKNGTLYATRPWGSVYYKNWEVFEIPLEYRVAMPPQNKIYLYIDGKSDKSTGEITEFDLQLIGV